MIMKRDQLIDAASKLAIAARLISEAQNQIRALVPQTVYQEAEGVRLDANGIYRAVQELASKEMS